jgi:hypothetical protein
VAKVKAKTETSVIEWAANALTQYHGGIHKLIGMIDAKENGPLSRDVLAADNFHIPKENADNRMKKGLDGKVNQIFHLTYANVGNCGNADGCHVPWCNGRKDMN